MDFKVRKNRHGAWQICFGKLIAAGVEEGGKREAARRCRVLNAEPETVERARVIEACIAEGAQVKLWHIAASAVVSAKSGEPTDAEALGSLLYDRMRDFCS